MKKAIIATIIGVACIFVFVYGVGNPRPAPAATNYTILESPTVIGLQTLVNAKLAAGFKCEGGVAFIQPINRYSQAVSQ